MSKRKDNTMENDKLQKIDGILKRTNATYAEAKQALDDANDDVLEAVILIENRKSSQSFQSASKQKGDQIIDQIKNVISKGNATKISIKKNNETIINIPITAGLIGALISPFLAAAGVTTALLTQCSVEITQDDGNIIDLNQKVENGMNSVKNAVEDGMDTVKNTMEDVVGTVTEKAENFKSSFYDMPQSNDQNTNNTNNNNNNDKNNQF
jgi:NACalpha-BTF3-like transcription factor